MTQADHRSPGEGRRGQDEMITNDHKDTFRDGEYIHYLDW